MADKSKKSFEDYVQELDTIVDSLEEGNLSLDQSLKVFEQGMKNIKHCKDILKKTEQKVSLLIEKNGEIEFDSFDKKERKSHASESTKTDLF